MGPDSGEDHKAGPVGSGSQEANPQPRRHRAHYNAPSVHDGRDAAALGSDDKAFSPFSEDPGDIPEGSTAAPCLSGMALDEADATPAGDGTAPAGLPMPNPIRCSANAHTLLTSANAHTLRV